MTIARFVDDIQGKLAVYSLFSFLLRAVEGVSAAGINTASFAMVAHTFPDSIGVIFVRTVVQVQGLRSVYVWIRIFKISLLLTNIQQGTLQVFSGF